MWHRCPDDEPYCRFAGATNTASWAGNVNLSYLSVADGQYASMDYGPEPQRNRRMIEMFIADPADELIRWLYWKYD